MVSHLVKKLFLQHIKGQESEAWNRLPMDHTWECFKYFTTVYNTVKSPCYDSLKKLSIYKAKDKAWHQWKHSVGIKGIQMFYISYICTCCAYCHLRLFLNGTGKWQSFLTVFSSDKGLDCFWKLSSFATAIVMRFYTQPCFIFNHNVTVFYVPSGVNCTFNKCFFLFVFWLNHLVGKYANT